MKFMRMSLTVALTLLLSSTALCQTITFGTLVDEMTDLYTLAQFPEPGYKTVQFSSYDRRSETPGGPDWYANSDGFGNEPVPNFEAVLKEPDENGVGDYLVCDVNGPGAIVRTWTAAIKGEVRVFLDGASDAIYEGSAQQFFQYAAQYFLKGTGIDPKLINQTFQQRNACYFPIPFSQRCRIEWRGNLKELHFYEVQIRLFEPYAEIATFEPTDGKVFQKKIKNAVEILSNIDEEWRYQSTQQPVAFQQQLKPGQVASAFELNGQGAIERLTVKLDANDIDAALRQTVIKISFDGFQT